MFHMLDRALLSWLAVCRRRVPLAAFAVAACLGSGVLAFPVESRAQDSQAESRGGEAASPAGVDEEEVNRAAEALAQKMMSPFCAGRTLSACPSPKAAEWRDDIRTMVRQGVPADEIRQRLAARIPSHDLFGIPKTPLGWALPIFLVLAAVALLVFLLRVLIKPTADEKPLPPPDPPPGSAKKDWDARLEQELEAID